MPVQQIGINDVDGATFGSASSKKISFYGTTPATRPAVTYNATITVTWVTISSGFGFSSSDQAVSVIGALKDIQHVLTTLGLWE
jgi:hypothetical protein